MTYTYISTDRSDIERWTAERDVVPVREDDGFALVHKGDADLDQERIRWNEFHAERDPETVVVVWRERTGLHGIEITDRETILDRAAIDESERAEVVARLGDGETVTVPMKKGTADPADPTATGDSAARDETDPTGGRTDPEERDVGKIVVAANGDQVGMVTAVEDEAIYVDPHPGMTERALGKLGWTGASDEDVSVEVDRIERITTQAVRLAGDAEEDRFQETTAGH